MTGKDAFTFFVLSFCLCLLTFQCVSLGIQQSSSSDLGYSTDWQLLTSIKLTRAGMAVLLFHKVHCVWSRHVEGRHNRQKIKIQMSLVRVGGWGIASAPQTDHTLLQQWVIILA